MNTDIIQGSLKDLRGDLKRTWSKLTDDDLMYIDGGVDQIIGKVQKAYGFTKERATEEFNKFRDKNTKYFSSPLSKESSFSSSAMYDDGYSTGHTMRNAQHTIQHDIIDPAREYMHKARDYGGHLVDRTTGMVKENPTYSVLGAATIGFLAGAYLFRRK